MVKTTVYLPEDLKAELEAMASELKRSEAALIRGAIMAMVSRGSASRQHQDIRERPYPAAQGRADALPGGREGPSGGLDAARSHVVRESSVPKCNGKTEILITIDASGRVVIPKRTRQRLRLTAGSRLRLEEDGERLMLVPEASEPSVIERQGLLIFSGRLVGEVPDHREVREERLGRLGGR
jgi:AbrB family looped-hinge helix DNA binding protein